MRSSVTAPFILLLYACLVMSQTTSPKHPQSSPVAQSSEDDEASRLGKSVVALYKSGKYDEALPIAKRLLQIQEQAFGYDDDRVVSAVLNLAEIQLSRKKNSEAKELFERAAHSYELTSGLESLKVASVLDRLAIAHYRLGRAADAERDFTRALAIREKVLGPEHHDIGDSLENLADFYQHRADYAKAASFYLRLIEIRRKEKPTELTVDALQRYACILRRGGREPEADKLEVEASALSHSAGGTETVSLGILNARALHLQAPRYPPEARAARDSGTVIVRVLIDESGKVIRACAIRGAPSLMSASESAAFQTTFAPTIVDGKPVKTTGLIQYNFVG